MDRRGIWLGRPMSLGRHVAVVLLAAVFVFVVAATALWLAVGAPRLPQGAAFTVTNQLELIKLAVVAGVGGVVALVVAYRRQTVVEKENERAVAAARRDDTRLFNERFGSSTTQLGHERPAVRAAAVYAVAGFTGLELVAGARFVLEGAVANGTRFEGDPLPAGVAVFPRRSSVRLGGVPAPSTRS